VNRLLTRGPATGAGLVVTRVSYNMARSRLDEIVDALGGEVAPGDGARVGAPQPREPVSQSRLQVLHALAAGEITHEEALRQLRQQRRDAKVGLPCRRSMPIQDAV
jgi:hypothetical protein